MGNIWFVADTHFGHEKAATFRGFDSVAEHDAVIVRNWNKVVRDEDTVFHLGDVALGVGEDPRNSPLNTVARLNGNIHLVLGNHDRAHPRNKNAFNHHWKYLNYFTTVQTASSISYRGTKLVMSHYPYVGDHTTEVRDVQWRLRDMQTPLVHGHTHSSNLYSESDKGTPQVCVSLEATGLKPLTACNILEILEEA